MLTYENSTYMHSSRTVFFLARTLLVHVRTSKANVRLLRLLLADMLYKDPSTLTEIQIAAVLKWRSYYRRYCGIGCFKSSLQWHRNTRFIFFCIFTGDSRAAKKLDAGDGGPMDPLPIVCRCLCFSYLIWWHLEHKWCNEPSAQLFYTAEISAHIVRCKWNWRCAESARATHGPRIDNVRGTHVTRTAGKYVASTQLTRMISKFCRLFCT